MIFSDRVLNIIDRVYCRTKDIHTPPLQILFSFFPFPLLGGGGEAGRFGGEASPHCIDETLIVQHYNIIASYRSAQIPKLHAVGPTEHDHDHDIDIGINHFNQAKNQSLHYNNNY